MTIQGKQYIAITAEDPDVAQMLLGLDVLGPCYVKIVKDPKKNRSFGVLWDGQNQFVNTSDAAFKELVAQYGVMEVERITTWKDKRKVNTQSRKLTFDTLICPKEVFINKVRYTIKEFVPAPLRCFKCNKYEHNLYKCRKTEYTCQRCGEAGHQARTYDGDRRLISSCTKPRKCSNCGGSHEAGHRDCPTQKDHRRINELIVNQKLSRQEARERVIPRGNGRTQAETVYAQQQQRDQEQEQRRLQREQDEERRKLQEGRDTDAAEKMAELTRKVDRLLERAGMSTPAVEPPNTQIEALRNEFNEKFKIFEDQIKKQNDIITELRKENAVIKKEKELEKMEKEKALREVQKLKDSALQRERQYVQEQLKEMHSQKNQMDTSVEENDKWKKRSVSESKTNEKEKPENKKLKGGGSNIPKSIRPNTPKGSNSQPSSQRDPRQSSTTSNSSSKK